MTPTILDWFGIPLPKYEIFKGVPVVLTGKSLLHKTKSNFAYNDAEYVFGSHNLHETTMYYPMRVVRSSQYKLIHNLNYKMPFPIDQDFYISPTFQDLLNRTEEKCITHWYKNLTSYYYRPQWELYDILHDPQELVNVVSLVKYEKVRKLLQKALKKWQHDTADPWICSPSAVLEDMGEFKKNPVCMPLYNDLD